jgi:hypothetical protein
MIHNHNITYAVEKVSLNNPRTHQLINHSHNYLFTTTDPFNTTEHVQAEKVLLNKVRKKHELHDSLMILSKYRPQYHHPKA